MKKLLFIYLFLVGCSYEHIDINNYLNGFDNYVAQFINDYNKYTGKQIGIYGLTITFSNDLKGNNIGECAVKDLTRVIRIKQTSWELLNESEKTILIYHELGHCILFQKHRENSIMNPYLFHIDSNEYDFYLKELFNYGKFDI